MNHKLRFHQEITRGKRFDENSVNTPGGIVVETKRAYETLLFFSSHWRAGLFMNFMSRNLTQCHSSRRDIGLIDQAGRYPHSKYRIGKSFVVQSPQKYLLEEQKLKVKDLRETLRSNSVEN